ncbi:MAG: Flp pilus assembly protein CpaB [Verrucomicrobiota bacterium]
MKRTVRSFFSAKWRDSAGDLLPLGIGVLLTGLALAAAGQRIATVERDLRRESNPVDVVVASVSIPEGETFTDSNLARKAVPASGTGRRNVPAAEFELLLGASAKNPIAPGEPILWTDVQEPFDTEAFSKLIRPGRRALTVSADASSSFAGLLLPGDRVDILAGSAETKNGIWVRDIPVIAVDRRHDRLARATDSGDATTLTLMVTPAEGARIAAAAASGKLHWFLRNPVDNGVAAPRGRSGGTLPARVEIWKGGLKFAAPDAWPGSPG